MCTHNKTSQLKELQRTTLDGSTALTSTWCTRALFYPPNHFLFLRLKNKLDFAAVVCTQIVLFWSKIHQGNTYLEWFQQRTSFSLGAIASKKCMRTLPYPPIHFLFLWLKNKHDFAAVVCTQIVLF